LKFEAANQLNRNREVNEVMEYVELCMDHFDENAHQRNNTWM
jgi:hypothetical protein